MTRITLPYKAVAEVVARGLVLALACLLGGCPQLLDDDYELALRSGTDGNTALGGGSDGGNDSEGGGRGGAIGGGGRGGVIGRGGASSGGGGASSGGAGAAGTGGASSCVLGPFSEPELVASLDRSGDLWGPSLSGDGLVLAFAESVDDEPEDIFLATRTTRATPFGAASAATGINTTAAEGTTFLGATALSLYFYSNRTGGFGGRDLYVATRATSEDDFSDARLVGGINSDDNDHMPWLSPDELTAYFASTRPANAGSSNIWVAERPSPDADFAPATELDNVNGPAKDESPALSADQLTLFFASERAGGSGNFDIWVATRDLLTSTFGGAEPVPIINSSAGEHNLNLSLDGLEMIFSSSRDGEEQLFLSTRTCR